MTDCDAEPTGVDEALAAALRTVFDPEIPVNVYDLGLIYLAERLGGGRVEIHMTLTAPGCPVADSLLKMVATAVAQVEGVAEVAVRLTFEPPWDMSRMSDEARLELGLV